MLTPKGRGSLSEAVFAALRSCSPEDLDAGVPSVPPAPDDAADEAVTLWALHELHYRGFEDVHDGLEWHRSYSFWPGLTADGYLRSLRKPGGWVGAGKGPDANDWLRFLDINDIEPVGGIHPGH